MSEIEQARHKKPWQVFFAAFFVVGLVGAITGTNVPDSTKYVNRKMSEKKMGRPPSGKPRKWVRLSPQDWARLAQDAKKNHRDRDQHLEAILAEWFRRSAVESDESIDEIGAVQHPIERADHARKKNPPARPHPRG